MKIDTLRRYAMSQVGLAEEPHHHPESFRGGGKIIATVPPGGAHAHVFVSDAAREAALTMPPEFVDKLLFGAARWSGSGSPSIEPASTWSGRP